MRVIAAGLALALAACGREKVEEGAAAVEVASAEPRVPCARGGRAFSPDCTVERSTGERGLTLTVRHPDGAFRRLLLTTDGRGVMAADGAEPARVTLAGADEIEVAVADERYRLPATARTP